MAAMRTEPAEAPATDLNAEAAVLAAVLLDPNALPAIRDTLEPRHFFAGAHQRIYAAAIRVADAGTPLEPLTVMSDLRARRELQTVGGSGYILETIASVDRIDNVAAYAEVVHTRWRQRQAVRLGDELAADGREVVGDVQAWLDQYRDRMDALTRGAYAREVESNHACLKRMLREMLEHNRDGRKRMGLSTGLRDVDELTLGLRPGHKYTVAALPGRGKTAFALHIATVTAKLGFGVLFISLEMDREEVLQRMLASEARVDGKRIMTNQLAAEEWPRVIAAMGVVGKLPVVFDCEPEMHVGNVAASARRWVEQMPKDYGVPLGLIVVDYLQRLAPPPSMRGVREKHRWVAESTRSLKSMAQQLKLPVLELAQQKWMGSEGDRPGKGCVADSREVDKESSVIAYLHRHDPKDHGSVEFIVAKQRNSEEGSCFVRFDGATQRWSNAPGTFDPDGRAA